MKNIVNKFGTGILYDETDIKGKIYCKCTACLSIYTDFLSWAQLNKDRIVKTPQEADSVIILGCQVTDLAILNDLQYAEKIQHDNIFMGGCLAQRFDIEIPYKRLDVIRIENQPIKDFALIDYAPPFWVKDFKENEDNFSQGNLFRNYYPLKIGAGCKGKCKYCTIKDTRGEYYEIDPFLQVEEFLTNENIVLISDSPTVKQINDWCFLAGRYNKKISIRNIEPQILVACIDNLKLLAKNGLLDIIHCPIQSNDMKLIEAMGRNVNSTLSAMSFMGYLREHGVKVATNIIIDYTDDKENFYPNSDFEFLNSRFDYVSWNPYFDGFWDNTKAIERWNKYITNDNN